MTLIKILAILFLALLVAVPLIQKFAKPQTPEAASRISRWVLPLVMLLAVLQLIFYFLRS